MAARYHEVVLQGERGRALGFVEGFLVARAQRGFVNMEAEGFDCEPLRERVRQVLRPGEDTLHLLLRPEGLAPLREAVGAAADLGLALALRDDRPVQGARFRFAFRIYSREHAARIRAWFEPAPPGVTLAEAEFEERIEPEARGLEAYAPEHDYELRGEATATGEIEAILALHRRCRDEELVREQPLELVV
jgi:hypothetical protein